MSWNSNFVYPSSHEQDHLLSHADYPRQLPVGSNSAPTYVSSNLIRDLYSVDDEDALRLRSTAKPLGDLCDSISFCRHPLGLSQPPDLQLLSERHRQRLPCGVIWFVRDCCGTVCLVFTWLLLIYAEFVVAIVILPRSPSSFFSWIAGSIYHFLTFMAGVSHIKSFATNPGAIPLGNATTEAVSYINEMHGDTYTSIIRCPKCLCIKPPRAHHCRMCSRCIRKMDHHCPWINNCVGEGNQKYFVLFTFYICLQSFFAIYMGAHFIFQCVNSDWELCYVDLDGWFKFISFDFNPFSSCVFIFGMIMEAFVFGLFTLVMCISQLCSIADDETGIESLKHNSGKNERYSRWKNLTLGCGSPFSWRWFSPFCSPPPLTPVFPGLIGSDVLPADWSNPNINNGFVTAPNRRTVVSL